MAYVTVKTLGPTFHSGFPVFPGSPVCGWLDHLQHSCLAGWQ